MCKVWRIKKASRKSVTVMVHGVHNNSVKHTKCSAPGHWHGLKEAIMKICSKSRALCSIQRFNRDVLKSYMAWGKARSPYSAWESDSPLILKLLLFLEMALCSGWCGSSNTDRQNPVQPPSPCHSCQAVQLNPNWSLRSSLVCSGMLRPSWGGSQHTTAYRKKFATTDW